IGSSGTARALGAINEALGHGDNVVSRAGLDEIRERLLGAGEIERIRLPGLSDDRRPVIAGGAVILDTVFRALGIDRMRVCDTAMREGLLYDMLGRAAQTDPREASIEGLASRYGADRAQADRVEATALRLFDQVAADWTLDDEHRMWLAWCARVHEIGLTIAHSQHHVHGAYLVGQSDLFGFAHQEQQALAFVVRAQRRAIPLEVLNALPDRLAGAASRLAVLLRLAALLHRARTPEPLPDIAVKAGERSLRVALPRQWLDAHTLTRADLDQERTQLAALNLKLQVAAV
ncbi:MAG: exopolyphosphatase, partial [Pseudomonadota bacterium]